MRYYLIASRSRRRGDHTGPPMWALLRHRRDYKVASGNVEGRRLCAMDCPGTAGVSPARPSPPFLRMRARAGRGRRDARGPRVAGSECGRDARGAWMTAFAVAALLLLA